MKNQLLPKVKKRHLILNLLTILLILLFTHSTLRANSIITLPGKNLMESDIEEMLDFNLFNPGVEEGKVLTDLVYKEVEGQKLELDVYQPVEGSAHPVIIFIHGGFFLRGDKDEIMELKPLLQAFLEQGWLVISANYRLINRANRFPQNVEDVKDAIRWVRKNAGKIAADPDRIGLMGYSAGGNLVLMAGLTEDEDFVGSGELSGYSAGVNFIISASGPTKLYGVKDFGFDLEKTLISYFYGDKLDNELLHKASPLTYLKKNAPPILLIHGTEDVIVPYTQALTFYQLAGEVGASCDLIKIKGGGHTIRLTYLARINSLQEDILYFMKKNLQKKE